MAAVIDAIGLASGALGIIGFIQSNVPEKPAEGASIRVKAGLPGDDDPGMGGWVDHTYAWDTNNNYLGQSTGGSIDPGDVLDVTIDSSSPGTRAEYVGVGNSAAATCISWITVKQFDDTPGGAWTGDIGKECGQNWYEQTEMAGYIDDAETIEYIPHCTWLDGDHTEDVPSAALKFSVKGYGEEVQDTNDNSKQCDLTIWGYDNAPINGLPQKRASRPREPWMERRLIVSNKVQHRAENMCSSDTSWGPDFVGTDGMFCDMGTKTLTPLCSTSSEDGCLDIDHDSKMIKKRSTVARRSVETVHKRYDHVARWE